jgi:aldehyde:ferredoxin oxidoreductase
MYTPRAEFEAMLNEYYEMRGWDPNGVPTAAKLQELGLAEVGEDFPATG